MRVKVKISNALLSVDYATGLQGRDYEVWTEVRGKKTDTLVALWRNIRDLYGELLDDSWRTSFTLTLDGSSLHHTSSLNILKQDETIVVSKPKFAFESGIWHRACQEREERDRERQSLGQGKGEDDVRLGLPPSSVSLPVTPSPAMHTPGTAKKVSRSAIRKSNMRKQKRLDRLELSKEERQALAFRLQTDKQQQVQEEEEEEEQQQETLAAPNVTFEHEGVAVAATGSSEQKKRANQANIEQGPPKPFVGQVSKMKTSLSSFRERTQQGLKAKPNGKGKGKGKRNVMTKAAKARCMQMSVGSLSKYLE